MRKERELWEKSDDIVHTLDMRHRTGQDRTGSDTMGSRVSFGDSRPQSITEGGGAAKPLPRQSKSPRLINNF